MPAWEKRKADRAKKEAGFIAEAGTILLASGRAGFFFFFLSLSGLGGGESMTLLSRDSWHEDFNVL